jgi:hypothetical protein
MAFVTATAAVRPALSRPALCASAFVGARTSAAAVRAPRASVTMLANMQPAFVKAMSDYKEEYAPFAKRGWGATVKAERWNGRHVMAGWIMLIGTAEARTHGLMPEGFLDTSQWGVLGSLGDGNPISMERAAIIVAHIHLLFVSVAATLAPFSFQDKLLLEDGEADEAPAGLFPAFTGGLTKEAELWNGRVAMVGLICLVATSAATKMSILDTINAGLGGKLF